MPEWRRDLSGVGRSVERAGILDRSLWIVSKLLGLYTKPSVCVPKMMSEACSDGLNSWREKKKKKKKHSRENIVSNWRLFSFGLAKVGCMLNITEWYCWKKIRNNLICARKLNIFSFSHFYTLSPPCNKLLDNLIFKIMTLLLFDDFYFC